MHILKVVASLPPYFSGTGNVALQSALALAEMGYKIHIVTPSMDSDVTHSTGKVEIWRVPKIFGLGLASVMAGLKALPEYDVLHLHIPFILGGDQAFWMALRHHKPVVVTYHQDLVGTGLIDAVFRAYLLLSVGPMLRAANAIVVPSLDFARQSVVADDLFLNGPPYEVPHGVDTERFSPMSETPRVNSPFTPDELKRTFLFVGALDDAHWFKGLDVLMKALSGMSVEANLIIVGEGNLRPGYEKFADRLGISNRTYFAGRASEEDLPDYYRATLCTVLPSVASEIFGLVLLEAMACGRPVIASALPGVRTVVDDGITGTLVTPGDVLSLRNAMKEMLDSNDAEKMGLHGRDRVLNHYTWPAAATRLSRVYQRVLSRPEEIAVSRDSHKK